MPESEQTILAEAEQTLTALLESMVTKILNCVHSLQGTRHKFGLSNALIPVVPVQTPVLDRFGNVLDRNRAGAVEIGHDSQYAMG
jgi:hypothetical protein